MLAAVIVGITLIAIIAVFWIAHLVDVTPAQKAFRAWKRAHRNAKRLTIIHERGHDQQTVGEWIKP